MALPALTRLSRGRTGGFTLIEILIVISIIAILSSLVLAGVVFAKRNAMIAAAKMEVEGLTLGLDGYLDDEAIYPVSARPVEPGGNEFPALYNALLGARSPGGPGGRSAPYARAQEAKTAVRDATSGELRHATRDEIRDARVEKYLLDPFQNPYVYRANKGRRPQPYSRNLEGADIYSLGPNEADDTVACAKESDDIGNW